MKKLNLDETWRLCLKMWKWITKEERKAGDNLSVWALKRRWMDKHGFEDVYQNCFFCEYNIKHKIGKSFKYPLDCHLCPVRRIDSTFYCEDGKIDWDEDPIEFYEKLLRLNKIRMAKKK